jgi:hypothetical protein
VSLIVAWVFFPLALAALGLGMGVLVERAAGTRVNDALLIPLGLAAAIVVAGTFDAFSATEGAAIPIVTIAAVAGLMLAWSGRRWPGNWPLLAALGALLAYGAPVIFSGEATFAGYIRLDDTAYWLNVIDHLFGQSNYAADAIPSTYSITNPGEDYPMGSFLLPGIGSALLRADAAWIFQPFLAFCGVGVAFCVYALVEPLLDSPRVRALVAFLASQSALLLGYSLWGAAKELGSAFPLVLMVALAAPLISRRPVRARELIPLGIAAGALIQALGPGAAVWVGLAFGAVAASWLLSNWSRDELWPRVSSLLWLAAITAACMVPTWLVLSEFLATDEGLFSSGQSEHTRFGNLLGALNGFQLAGIWPVGDFRLSPPTVPTVLLVGLVLAAALGAIWVSIRRRSYGIALYVGVALGGCAVIYVLGATPWVVAKAMAICSPALLAAGLAGAALLWNRRTVGAVLFAILAFGVLWSTALAYRDVVLAPRDRLAELQRIGESLDGHAPTLLNEYEIYGNAHFLRAGAPVGPAEYRPVELALRDGTLLTKSAWADLDSLPLETVEEYPSVVTRNSPSESHPPSNYRRVWEGDYYSLWQRDATPATNILEHVPFGESTTLPYCGSAINGEPRAPCSVDPVAVPPCSKIEEIAGRAEAAGANLVADIRPAPIVARGDETLWPAPWYHDPEAHTVLPTAPGEVVAKIAVDSSQAYELWLGGTFTRGFEISVDGRSLGTVENEQSTIGGYTPIGEVFLSEGVHEFELTYLGSDLTPGSGNNDYTQLQAISLVKQLPVAELATFAPTQAEQLCGRPLDWVEIVAAG